MKCKNCKNLGYGYDEGRFFGWCEKTLDSPDEKTDRDCRFFQQKTNADRIRAMSDKEMLEFLSVFFRVRYDRKDWLDDWLQQPAEED